MSQPSHNWNFLNKNHSIFYVAFRQAYCNIMAGAAFCIGLKYAGTSDPRAIMVLTDVFTRFLSFTNQATMKRAGKPTAENCLMLTLLALSMVRIVNDPRSTDFLKKCFLQGAQILYLFH